MRLFQPCWSLLRDVLGFGFRQALLLKRERTLQDHLYRCARRVVDLVAASKENLGQASCSSDSAADEGPFASSRESANDRTFRRGSGDRASILPLGSFRLHASLFIDHVPIVRARNIVDRTRNRNGVAAGENQCCEMKQ